MNGIQVRQSFWLTDEIKRAKVVQSIRWREVRIEVIARPCPGPTKRIGI